MRQLSIVLVVLLASTSLIAQKTSPAPKAAAAEQSDPKAKALLEKVRKQYESYNSMECNFSLTIEMAEQKKEVQKGKLVQQGDKYHVDMPKQAIICDGKTLWLHQKANKEVQVNNADASGGDAIMSPKDLMRIYQKNEYLYAITGEGNENGKTAIYIEFKPIKKSNEYSKLRLAVDKKNNQIIYIKAFARDGSKYTMALDKLITNKKYDSTFFAFDKAKNPGVRVEDLRID